MPSSHKAWVLVADGQRARILERENTESEWFVLPAETREVDDPPTHEQGSERPGRVNERGGSASRHAIQPRSDYHEAAKVDFAKALCGRLEVAANAHQFGRLILVAPPHFLGVLRQELGDAARGLLRGTLDKDLTQAPVADVVAHLKDHRPM
jgi:protein required for attachment to host cells